MTLPLRGGVSELQQYPDNILPDQGSQSYPNLIWKHLIVDNLIWSDIMRIKLAGYHCESDKQLCSFFKIIGGKVGISNYAE